MSLVALPKRLRINVTSSRDSIFFDRLRSHSQAELERVCDFIGYDGTPVWDDSTGSDLLRKWLARFDGPASLPWLDTAGSFALLIGGPQGVWLANDAIGLQKIYRRRDGAMYSSSLLAVRGSIAQPRVRRLRAQEYVLLESNHGLETPLAEVDIADPTTTLSFLGPFVSR